jgi:hypothetical protein
VQEDDIIGCHITLASGAEKHIDMPASVVTQQCNRR